MPARAVVEHRVAKLARPRPARSRDSCHTNGRRLSYCAIDGLRLGQRLADHLGKLLHAGAVDLGEVDCLRHVAIEAGHLGDDGVKVGVGIAAVELGGFLGARQIAQHGVMHDEAEFLL